MEVDGEIDLREFCFARIIGRHLQQASQPTGSQGRNRASKSDARRAALSIVRIVADRGHPDPDAREKAYRAGVRVFGDWASKVDLPEDDRGTVEKLSEALDIIEKINFAGRKSLVDAVARDVGRSN